MRKTTKKKIAPIVITVAVVLYMIPLMMLLLAALLIGLGVQIYGMFGKLQEARAEEAIYTQRLNELQEVNEQLREDLENSGNQALIEDIARDQLGMVLPGEKVFHFSK